MSSPRTPRSGRRAASSAGSGASTPASSRRSRSRAQAEQELMDTSDMSDLARPLPSSPVAGPGRRNGPPSVASSTSFVAPTPVAGIVGPSGPGSVLVSEIDLSSPLNYGTPGSAGSLRTPGLRGTPIRIRSDIQSEKRLRQVNVGNVPSQEGASNEAPVSDAVAPSEGSTDAMSQLVIWGTDVSVASCKAKFQRFLRTFMDPEAEEDEKTDGFDPREPLYLQKLDQVCS